MLTFPAELAEDRSDEYDDGDYYEEGGEHSDEPDDGMDETERGECTCLQLPGSSPS